MPSGSNAVIDLVRETSTRRLEADPGDDELFESREAPRRRAARGTIDWSPPPPEPPPPPPVTYPRAPVKKRAWWKLAVVAVAGMAGFAVAVIGFSKTDQVSRPSVDHLLATAQQPVAPDPTPVVAPVPAEPPPASPAAVPTFAPKPTDPANAPAPTDPTAAAPAPTDPTIADAPDAQPKAVKPAPKAKRHVHVTKRVARPKHVAAAPATRTTTPPPAAPAAPAAPARHAAQAHDTENPL